MNKAVIYISGTTNETVNNMIVEVLERYCEKHEYEIVALLGENSQAGMSMPMKYSFIGMAEVEDIDAVVTLSSAMVGTADKEVMETIDCLPILELPSRQQKKIWMSIMMHLTVRKIVVVKNVTWMIPKSSES